MAGDVKRVALVIGNGAYTAAPPLMNPRNDAQGMGGILAQLGFAVISGLDLGRDAMEDKLIEFETAIGGASAAMLFYAGHGLQVKGQNYLVPVDAEIHQEIQLKRRAFSLDEILDIMVRRARASLVFLDACRDNPFSRSLLSGMSAAEQKRYLVRSGLAEVKASQGSFVAFATAPDNVASDGRGSNSPFTGALLAHIETPDVSVSDMMIAVRNDVLAATDGRQEPWDQSSLRERFCFKVTAAAKPPEPEQVSPAPIDDRTVEHTWWVNIQNSQDESDFEGFLAKFPHGEYVQLAKTRLAELEWNRIKGSKTVADFEAFIARWPDNRLKAAAQTRLAALSRKAKRSGKGIPWKVAAGVGVAVVMLVAGYALWPGSNDNAINPDTPSALELAETKRREKEAQERAEAKARAEAEAEAKRQREAKAQAEAERLERERKAAARRGKVTVMVRMRRGRDEEQWLKPGAGKRESFQDCINRSCSVKGPEMVVVPKGRFMMGSNDGAKDEKPVHRVTIGKPFAVGKFEVTFAEWDACVADRGCNHKPEM